MTQEAYSVFDGIVARYEKEQRLKQKSKIIWFTGLSGSGKTTLAVALEKALFEKSYHTQILDGDIVRSGINKNLGFSLEDRKENIRRVAEISKLLLNCGIVCICAFVSPTQEIRQIARDIIGNEDFLEIFVSTPIEVCENRDNKGLYKKARAGEIVDFTGITATFEMPANAFLTIDTTNKTVDECIEIILAKVLSEIAL